MKLYAPQTTELKPRIVVFGVGGAGGNAVNNMIEAGLEGVEFVVANTDAQQLAFSKTPLRIQLGVQVTQGLGAGAHPEVGMSAAEESTVEIGEHLDGAHMVFITAGMGGGTGTGAAPIIAKCARERGILTVGVVTKPFHFEGRHRMRLADSGIAELQRYVDTLIVIPNQNLFRIANEKTTFAEAFGMADQVLHSGVRSITDLMVLPGLINLDFADVRTVMTEMGKAMMGTGEAAGEDRALMAAQNAIANPLLDEVSLKGAKAVLVNVTGGLDMTLLEVDEAANAITEQVDADANVIFGAAFDPSLEGVIRVSVVATGMDGASMAAIEPSRQRNTTAKPLIAGDMRAPEPAPVARPEPVVASIPEPAQQYWSQPAAPEPEAIRPEPVTIAGPAFEPETAPKAADYGLFDAPVRQPEIRTAAVAPPQQRTLIVDPLVDDAPAEDFTIDPHFEQREERKTGWMSLFGGRRQPSAYEQSPPPQARAAFGGGARPAPQPVEDLHQEEEGDDLEIPSFLRRLAN
ncbi:cell division protein FtsZ [Caulobacter sp. NIBR1757]|uniref:cell division protein FtsZ n=1 Tax=Caulobacter sp. NIBR1757 TaxID=3016000 RepID=UPI0022F03F9C|nr:cell division protein FtsZ [Caulobacter sp. NIBR1757]WGM39964.1 Cell division protein FtsZ [Caulobacter sp. NIBR1757]